jgi:hypothetical protein
VARRLSFQQRLRNPATRAKIPTSRLPVRYQRMRAGNRRRARLDADPLYDPAQQLSGHRLSSAVDRLVALEFAPKEQALTQQESTTRTQGTALMGRAGDYYRQIAQQEAGNVARQQALSARLKDELAGIASSTQTAIGGQTAAQDKAQAQDVAVRGEGLAGGGDARVTAELAAQRAAAAQGAQAFQSTGVLQGGNYEGLAGSTSAATAQRGGETQAQLANRMANTLSQIGQARADLGTEKGNERVKQLLALRQSGFENLATMKGLGIKEEDLQVGAAQKAAERALARQRQREASRHNRAGEQTAAQRVSATTQAERERERHNRAMENRPVGRGRGGTPRKNSAAAEKTLTGIQNVAQDYQGLMQGRDPKHPGRRYSRPDVARILRDRGAPPIVLLAGADIANFGYILPHHVRQLQSTGVIVPKSLRTRPKRR